MKRLSMWTISPEHEHALRELPAALPEALTGLNESQTKAMRHFFRVWLRLPATAQQVIASRVSGLSYWDAGELAGISAQAAHKAYKKAEAACPVIEEWL